MCEEAVCRLILTENNENIKAFEIKSDPRTWNSGTDTVIECHIPKEVWTQKSQQTKLFLQLTRKRDGRIIEWANEEYDHKAGGIWYGDETIAPRCYAANITSLDKTLNL